MRQHSAIGRWWLLAGVLAAGVGCVAPSGQTPSGSGPAAPDATPRGDAEGIDDPEVVPPGADAPPPPLAIRHADVTALGTVVWNDSGLDVIATEVVAITAVGEVSVGTSTNNGPAGQLVYAYAFASEAWAINHGAAIGKIGPAGAPFLIGPGVTFTAPLSGRLFVGQNDITTGDNGGSFAISIDVGPIGTVATVPGGSSSVSVPSTVAWTDTGIELVLLEQVSFLATGTINLSATVTANADGSPDPAHRPSNIIGNSNHGVLLGKIGNGIPFPVGRSLAMAAPYPGRLYLGVNDVGLTNNAGALATTITVASP